MTSWISLRGGVSFFLHYPHLWRVLARAAATPTASYRTCTRMHLAKSPLHVFTAEYGSESTSELRSLGEVEINARMCFRRPRVFVLRL